MEGVGKRNFRVEGIQGSTRGISKGFDEVEGIPEGVPKCNEPAPRQCDLLVKIIVLKIG